MKTRHLRILFVLGLGLILALLWLVKSPSTGLPISRAAGPWYVAPGGDDVDDCQSPSTPCATINGAIAKASSGDTIYVAIGTYTGDDGSGDYEVVVLDKDITLSGGWEFGTLVLQSGISTIDGEGSYQGIVVNSGVTTTVDHFAIQNGYTNDRGGGIHNSGTLTLTNSTISGNTANGEGGGISTSYDSHLSLSRSWIVANASLSNDAGGINCDYCNSVSIENTIIAGNVSADSAGGILFGDDGDGGPYRIVNSHIVGNRASGEGAAIATFSPIQVELTNTLVISNRAIRASTTSTATARCSC